MNHVFRETQKLLKEYGTADPRELADFMDIHIIEYPFKKLRGIYFTLNNYKFAVINSNLSIPEQQFTLLHEIAHARLHPELNFFTINKNRLIVTGKFEHQADLLAATLFLKHVPEDCRISFGNQLLGRIPEYFLKNIFQKEDVR